MSDILLKVEEVAKAVGIAASTVRKYSFLIEKHGYEFSRNNQNALMFDQDEVSMFKELVRNKKQKNMTLENAVQTLLSNMSDVATTSDIATTDMSSMPDVRAMFTTISDMSTNMYTIVEQNKDYEKRRIEDHDKLLMQSIRAEQQAKKLELKIEELQNQIAATKEEPEKKSWWQKLWSKS